MDSQPSIQVDIQSANSNNLAYSPIDDTNELSRFRRDLAKNVRLVLVGAVVIVGVIIGIIVIVESQRYNQPYDPQCGYGYLQNNITNNCTCYYLYNKYPGQSSCDYEMKSEFIGYSLQFAYGLSAGGYWYIGWYVTALIETILNITAVLLCRSICCVPWQEENSKWKKLVPAFLTTTAAFTWWLVSVLLYKYGDYRDDNGYPLESYRPP